MRYLMFSLVFVLLSFCPGTRSYSPDTDQSVMATLWYQRSGEMRALYYQAFNLAEMRVCEYLAGPDRGRPPAVVFDLDETLLDNSPSEARNILEGKPYSPARWKAWTDQASAGALPGAVDFCRFLARKGIDVYYISNRRITELASTIRNMKNLDFPQTDTSRYLLRTDVSGKESRRSRVGQDHDLILLIGDNLSDFDRVFEDRSVNFGFHAVDSLREAFGRRFILLPNPMYGDWTRPLQGSPGKMTPRKSATHRRSLLRAE